MCKFIEKLEKKIMRVLDGDSNDSENEYSHFVFYDGG